jgi:protease-4
VPLDGELFVSQLDATAGSGSAANDVVAQIEQATNDDSIKGIVLRINSPGGSPVGGEMIAQALRAAGKPTVALIQDLGDSAAYFAATGGDWIIASPFSDVGDIGVTSSYVDNSKADTKNGQTFVQISTGKYKDAGNPDKMLTDDERALLQKNVDEAYATLVDEIALNRSMPTSTVKALANGASMPASEAIGKGLVDELGGATAAREWFVTKLADKDVTLCRILQ